ARTTQPHALEIRAGVHLAHFIARLCRRIVRDHVSVRVETANDEEMPVRLSEQEAWQIAVDRCDERDARGDETPCRAKRTQPTDDSFDARPRAIRPRSR